MTGWMVAAVGPGVGLLVAAAVLVWPNTIAAERVLGRAPGPGRAVRRGSESGALVAVRAALAADPVVWWRERRARRDVGAVAALALLDALAPALGAGLPVRRALTVAVDCLDDRSAQALVEFRADAERRLAEAEPLAPAWSLIAVSADLQPSLDALARAWALSEQVGAPLASAAQRGAASLRAGIEHRGNVRAATAGARASVSVLSLLPASGPLLVMLSGIDVASAYLGGPLAIASWVAGVALSLLGRWWCRRLEQRVSLPLGEQADVAGTLRLLALAHRAGLPMTGALDTVAHVSAEPVGRALATVSAAVAWGATDAQAWGAVGPQWQPAHRCHALAAAAGVPVAGLLDRVADDLDREVVTDLRERAAKLGVHLVLPLALALLPGFLLIGIVPMVLALVPTALL